MKKVLALILCVVMLMALLTACQPKEKTPPVSSGDPSTNVPDDDGFIPSAYGGVPVSPPGVLPIVKEPVELTILIAQHSNIEVINK